MHEIKELNSEIFSVAKNKNSGDTKRADLVKLSVKTNRLLKKILLRRFQLEQEAKYIKTMSNKVANREDDDDDGATIDPRESGIDKVISKLKTMIHDLDSTEDKPGGVNVFFFWFIFVCVRVCVCVCVILLVVAFPTPELFLLLNRDFKI